MNAIAKTPAQQLFFGLLCLCAGYGALLYILNLPWAFDERISDLFFNRPCLADNARQCWFFDKSDRHLSFLLHDLPTHFFTLLGFVALIVALISFYRPVLRAWRAVSLATLAGLCLVPATVFVMKLFFGHYCPGQLAYFGGPVQAGIPTHIKPFCYPASFPAAGFSLVVLYFCRVPRRWQLLGLIAGLALGLVQSIVQIARGEHFVTHCLATLLTAVFVGFLIKMTLNYKDKIVIN